MQVYADNAATTKMSTYKIRPIEEKDNERVEQIIRSCLIEFGADHEGTAWMDENLGRFSQVYSSDGNKYWVAEDENGNIVGGTGIGYITDEICELQKMYCVPEARGKGAAHKLIREALAYAKLYYKKCYLETFENMVAANIFYMKYGFSRIDKPVADTGHYACDRLYIKEL